MMIRIGKSAPVPVHIDTEYIKLEQFLKLADLISTGGEAKYFIAEHKIFVNGEREERRGRKLREGDQIEIDRRVYVICT